MLKLVIPVLVLILVACNGSQAKQTPATTAPETSTTIEHPAFDADSAFGYVAAQVAMGPRVPGTDAHKRCEAYIVDAMKRFGTDTVGVQRGTAKAFDGTSLPIANIIATVNPKAPKRILLLAHYDTRPWADREEDEALRKKPIDGANDGGSGVGVMLEIARVLGQKRPDIGVDFLFTDVEDYGTNDESAGDEDSWCLGTQYWAASNPYGANGAIRPAYGVLLDMVGGRNARFHREYISSRMAPSVVDRVWGLASLTPYADRFPNEMGGSIVDDHVYVNSAGIPCIDIIECANPATGGFPPTWHTLADNIDNIDRTSLKAVGEVLLDLIYSEPAN